jgi:hypothetical protein
MATNLKYAVALKNAKLNAISTYAGASAQLNLYNGVQPTNPDTALSGNTLLATLICNGTAFAAAAASGVLTANAIASGTGTAGASTGTNATFFRLFQSNGTTPVLDGTIGTSAADLILNNTSIAQNQTVSVSSLTVTEAN